MRRVNNGTDGQTDSDFWSRVHYVKTSRENASYGRRYRYPALYSFLVEFGLQHGSGPDRGRSPM